MHHHLVFQQWWPWSLWSSCVLWTVVSQRTVGMLSLVVLCPLDCDAPEPSSFQEVTPLIVLQLCQWWSTCEDTLSGQGHMSNIELDTENWFVRSGPFYFPTAGAGPEAFMLHFLNTSKTGWGCSQIRQTAGLMPISWGNPETLGWVLRAEYPLWTRTRKAWLPSSLLFQHNQEYEEAAWEASEGGSWDQVLCNLQTKVFISPGSSPWPHCRPPRHR